MIDPSLELHRLIYETLVNHPAVTAEVGEDRPRVYDAAPNDAEKPYITLGPPQVLPDRADCIDGAETSYPIHGWTNGPRSVTIKRLGAAIALALDGVEFELVGHQTVLTEVEQIVYLEDPDGLTRHVAVTLRVLTTAMDEITGAGALAAGGAGI